VKNSAKIASAASQSRGHERHDFSWFMRKNHIAQIIFPLPDA
jgi:hypothetical protein